MLQTRGRLLLSHSIVLPMRFGVLEMILFGIIIVTPEFPPVLHDFGFVKGVENLGPEFPTLFMKPKS